MKVNYDVKADAMYVYLSNKPYAYGRDLDDWRRVDYSAEGLPVGVEILNVSEGVNVSGLPNLRKLAEAIERHGFKTYFLNQYAYTKVGFTQNMLIMVEPNNNQIDVVERGESIVVFDLRFDSPVDVKLEADREVKTA